MATKKRPITKTVRRSAANSSSSGVAVTTDDSTRSLTLSILDDYEYEVHVDARRVGKVEEFFLGKQCFWNGSGWVCTNLSSKSSGL